jgi:hypothetical protein
MGKGGRMTNDKLNKMIGYVSGFDRDEFVEANAGDILDALKELATLRADLARCEAERDRLPEVITYEDDISEE